MSKHTPGPWEYRDNKIIAVNAQPEWAVGDEEYADERITVVNLMSAMGGDDSAADARLITEAPAMLEALRKAEYFLTGTLRDPARVAEANAHAKAIAVILTRIEQEA